MRFLASTTTTLIAVVCAGPLFGQAPCRPANVVLFEGARLIVGDGSPDFD